MDKKKGIFHRINWAIDRFLAVLSAICLGVLTCVVFYSVLSRYLLNSSIAWAEELSTFLLIWVVFTSTIVVYNRSEHLGLDFLVSAVPKPASFLMTILAHIGILVCGAFLLLGGWEMMREGMDTLSPALRIRYGYVYTVLPLSGTLLVIGTLAKPWMIAKAYFKDHTTLLHIKFFD
ncbi:TRAP transporter small permease [Oscillospiraceae bacterium LTW-04]